MWFVSFVIFMSFRMELICNTQTQTTNPIDVSSYNYVMELWGGVKIQEKK